jgi:hypothetical protein
LVELDGLVLIFGCSFSFEVRRTRGTVTEETEDNKNNFPSDYIVVDRILACEDVVIKKKDGTSQPTRMYLVKWCSLPYLEATWETAEDIKDDQKIKDFFRFNTPPPPPPPPPLQVLLIFVDFSLFLSLLQSYISQIRFFMMYSH